MTTAPRPGDSGTGAGPAAGSRGILLRTAAVATVAVVATTLAGMLFGGSAGALGALAGGGLVVLVFATGGLAVDLMARRSAVEAMLTALTAFFGQVIVLGVLLVLLSRSGVVGDEVSRGWLAGGVIAVALTWSLGHLIVFRRARIPLYELPGQRG